jgi:exopolyphosphatase/guanosine-5'-triphosphate,3'-diphosphate pyrophosphatase
VGVAPHGRIGPAKLREVEATVARYARLAREARAHRIEVLVTAPGRQSENADELVHGLTQAAGAPARVISADEEGELAYAGAIAGVDGLPETVAVVDVGGGSTEIVVGSPESGPAWARSVDIGCVRLTGRRLPDDPPGKQALAAAAADAEEAFAGLIPPIPLAALAAGGTARALRKVVGDSLGPDELEIAARKAAKRSSRRLADEHGLDRSRARMLAAGAVILGVVQRRLGLPLVVARGGLREGAALQLLAELRAA